MNAILCRDLAGNYFIKKKNSMPDFFLQCDSWRKLLYFLRISHEYKDA